MKELVYRNKISFLILSISLVVVLLFSIFVVIYDNLIIDTMVYEFLINNFSSSFFDKLMINITKLGNTNFVMLLVGILFIFFLIIFKNKLFSIVFIFSVSGVAFINQLLKFTIKRIRPNINRMIEIGGYSFPSGHAMVSVVLYGLIAYISYKYIKVKWVKWITVFSYLLLIFLICISRIYLGVHYFSDVIVGVFASLIFLVIIINFLEKKLFSQN